MTEQRKCAEIDPLSDFELMELEKELQFLEDELKLIEARAPGTEFICIDIRDMTISELMKRIRRENIRGDCGE